MSNISGIAVGSLLISGTRNVILRYDDDLPEYPVVGLEGGFTERMGSRTLRIELRGFFESGDRMKDQLLALKGVITTLAIPSHLSGNYFAFASGIFLLENINVNPVAGRGHSYYEWAVKGTLANPFSGTGALPTNGSQIIITFGVPLAIQGIDYSQTLSLGISVHPDYSQNLPIGISAHPDYSQVLPLGISVHPDYNQTMNLEISAHANYVRIS